MANFNDVNFEEFLEGVKLRGGKRVENFNNVSIVDTANSNIHKNDVIKFITTYKIENSFNGYSFQSVLVPSADGYCKSFYFSAITRRFAACDKDCNPITSPDGNIQIAESTGSFVRAFKKFNNLEKACKALDGMIVEVTDERNDYRAVTNNNVRVAVMQKTFTLVCVDEEGAPLSDEDIETFVQNNLAQEDVKIEKPKGKKGKIDKSEVEDAETVD